MKSGPFGSIEPNQRYGIAWSVNGSQMDVNELHQYVSQLREYIVALERRITTLEKQVNPPLTMDLGNGRTTFTRAGVNKLLDGMRGRHRKDPVTGEWHKVN